MLENEAKKRARKGKGRGGGVRIQCTPFLRTNIWHRRVGDHPAVKEFDNVKRSTNNTVIFAQAVRLGDGNIRFLQSMDYTVFAVHAVRCFGDQFSRWLLPQDKLLPVRSGKLVSRIRLTISKL